jgi:glutamine synthetase
VNLQFTDILGVIKNVTIPAHKLSDTIQHGLWFDGSSIEGFTRIHESDMYLQPDLDTYTIIPWTSGDHTTAKLVCDVYTPDREPFAGDPRGVLRRVLSRATEMGFRFNTGPELEFFLLQPDGTALTTASPHDNAGYFDVTTDLGDDVRKEMVNTLEAFGIVVEASHHEVAVGQHEIDFKYGEALATADNAITFRMALKAIAQRHGLWLISRPAKTSSTMPATNTSSRGSRGTSLPASSNTPAA